MQEQEYERVENVDFWDLKEDFINGKLFYKDSKEDYYLVIDIVTLDAAYRASNIYKEKENPLEKKIKDLEDRVKTLKKNVQYKENPWHDPTKTVIKPYTLGGGVMLDCMEVE